MKCSQCNKQAIFYIGSEDQPIPVCLDCRLKYVHMLAKQNEMLEREINYLTASMESVAGIPPILPRYPERKIIHSGDVTLNNIKIDNSTIGVINTGNIESIDMAVTSLTQSNEREMGKAILELSESILKQTEINDEIKNQLIELVSVIATEATAPKESRRKSILRPLISELASIIGGIAGLSEIWETVKPIIESLIQ